MPTNIVFSFPCQTSFIGLIVEFFARNEKKLCTNGIGWIAMHTWVWQRLLSGPDVHLFSAKATLAILDVLYESVQTFLCPLNPRLTDDMQGGVSQRNRTEKNLPRKNFLKCHFSFSTPTPQCQTSLWKVELLLGVLVENRIGFTLLVYQKRAKKGPMVKNWGGFYLEGDTIQGICSPRSPPLQPLHLQHSISGHNCIKELTASHNFCSCAFACLEIKVGCLHSEELSRPGQGVALAYSPSVSKHTLQLRKVGITLL